MKSGTLVGTPHTEFDALVGIARQEQDRINLLDVSNVERATEFGNIISVLDEVNPYMNRYVVGEGSYIVVELDDEENVVDVVISPLPMAVYGIYRGLHMARLPVIMEEEHVGDQWLINHKIEVGITHATEHDGTEVFRYHHQFLPVSFSRVFPTEEPLAHDINQLRQIEDDHYDVLDYIANTEKPLDVVLRMLDCLGREVMGELVGPEKEAFLSYLNSLGFVNPVLQKLAFEYGFRMNSNNEVESIVTMLDTSPLLDVVFNGFVECTRMRVRDGKALTLSLGLGAYCTATPMSGVEQEVVFPLNQTLLFEQDN